MGLLPTAPEPAIAETLLYDLAIPPPRRLIGRTDLVQQIRQRLCAAAPVERLSLHGLPGVGKTALAIALVHDRELQERFRDGILWAGFGPQPNIPAMLGITMAEAVQTGGLDAWALALRMAIGKRHMLLVLDDVMSGDSKTRWPSRSPARIAPACSQRAFPISLSSTPTSRCSE